MRHLMYVTLPIEPFNTLVRNGTAGAKIKSILDAQKPEAAYFTEQNGQRGAVLVLDISDASQIPVLAEPWFLTFNAAVEIRIAMTAEDLGKSGIDSIAKKWH